MEVNGGVWLPEDVIFAVLSWLPVKPLCRFRCVSKGWRALISSAAFVAAQKSRAAPLLVGVFAASPDEAEKEPDELRVMDADGNVLRVLRGVLQHRSNRLLQTRLDLVCVDKWSDGATIIDPATRRVVTVGRRHVHGEGQRLGPMHRFGRAAPSGAYKLVRLYDKFFCCQVCEVATLGDGDEGMEPTWRERPGPPFRTCWCASCAVTINGVIYFLPRGACVRQDLNRIASFDLEREEWKKTTIHGRKLSYSKQIERWRMALGELKGALCMVETVRSELLDSMYTNVDIWVLVDSQRSIWEKQYTVQSPNSLFRVKPLDVFRDGRLLLLKTIEDVRGEMYTRMLLQLYHPSTGTFTDLREMSKEFRGEMALYTGSILSWL